jgi:hypothetical protein
LLESVTLFLLVQMHLDRDSDHGRLVPTRKHSDPDLDPDPDMDPDHTCVNGCALYSHNYMMTLMGVHPDHLKYMPPAKEKFHLLPN